MEDNPRNCLAPCAKRGQTECPAVRYEQETHMLGFSETIPRVTKVIGCASFPEAAPQVRSHRKK